MPKCWNDEELKRIDNGLEKLRKKKKMCSVCKERKGSKWGGKILCVKCKRKVKKKAIKKIR